MTLPDPTADFPVEDEPVARIVEVFELGEELVTRAPAERSEISDASGPIPQE